MHVIDAIFVVYRRQSPPVGVGPGYTEGGGEWGGGGDLMETKPIVELHTFEVSY